MRSLGGHVRALSRCGTMETVHVKKNDRVLRIDTLVVMLIILVFLVATVCIYEDLVAQPLHFRPTMGRRILTLAINLMCNA